MEQSVGNEGSDDGFPPEKPARKIVTFDVNLHNGGCEDRVTEALDEQDGKSEIDTDADEQRVEVTFNPHEISAEDLRDTLSDLGYTVTVVEAPTPAD